MPCSEVYRGSRPFSEPETQAVKNLVKSHPNIISAMNFHCFGNLWIRPFNYVGKNEIDPMNTLPIARAYNFFEKAAPIARGGIVANALKAVNYPATGEASDWML